MRVSPYTEPPRSKNTATYRAGRLVAFLDANAGGNWQPTVNKDHIWWDYTVSHGSFTVRENSHNFGTRFVLYVNGLTFTEAKSKEELLNSIKRAMAEYREKIQAKVSEYNSNRGLKAFDAV